MGGMAANFQHNGQFQQTVYHQAMVEYEKAPTYEDCGPL
jgi:hypothetical protein